MLTARDEVTDKIIGWRWGGRYLTKPFDPKELVSRIRAVLRRTESKTPVKTIIQIAELNIDVAKRQVRRDNVVIDLTPNEFELLRVMAENPGQVFSRMQLLDQVQGDAYEGYERTIDSHIKNLRSKDRAGPRTTPLYYGLWCGL
jgi:DNA-binding response OmpR family regulator